MTSFGLIDKFLTNFMGCSSVCTNRVNFQWLRPSLTNCLFVVTQCWNNNVGWLVGWLVGKILFMVEDWKNKII